MGVSFAPLRCVEACEKHLKDLGHKRIAFLRGQQQNSDSVTRWEALEGVASELEEMRRIATKTVVGLIDGQEEYVQEIAVEPKLVVRGSTAAPPQA